MWDLDADIGGYFGYEIANDAFPKSAITLRQLMSHTSSLCVNAPKDTRSPSAKRCCKKGKEKSAYFAETMPGNVYAYSNLGAALPARFWNRLTGVSVNRYMRENVFGPLAIDAAYDPAALKDPARVASLYYRNGTRYMSAAELLEQPYEDFADPEHHYRATVGRLWIRARIWRR